MLFVLFFLLSVASCHVQRKIEKEGLKNYSKNKLHDLIVENQNSIESFSSRFSSNININNQKYSFKGNLRIKTDSIIWISISAALGIELIRMICTPDSLQFVYRLDQSFYSGDYEFIKEKYNLDIDFNTLQSLLLNRYMLVNNDNPRNPVKGYYSFTENGYYLLQSIKPRKIEKLQKKDEELDLFVHKLIIEPDNFNIKNNIFEDFVNNRKLSVEYNSFKKYENKRFPNAVSIHADDNKSHLDINLNLSRIEFNKRFRYSFKIAEKYKEMKLN